MNEYIVETYHFLRNGKGVVETLRHPRSNITRIAAIQYFVTNGCHLTPDTDNVPRWMRGLATELQEQIIKVHPDLINYYKLRIPEFSSIKGLTDLRYIREIRHLYIANAIITPEDISTLDVLENLEVLILVGNEFCDEHIHQLPTFATIRAIDVQGTGVTSKAANSLKEKYPNVEIYVPKRL